VLVFLLVKIGVYFFSQMKPEKKALELSDVEKTIFDLLKANNRTELGALKVAAALSGKQWDKGMKGLSKLGLTKVEVDGDAKFCYLN
jgi:lysyl-tRNA synthetase class 2